MNIAKRKVNLAAAGDYIREKTESVFNRLYERVPQCVLGKPEDWKLKLYTQCRCAYFPQEAEARIRGERKRLFAAYLVILLCSLLFFAGSLLARQGELPQTIRRPLYGEEGYRLPLEAEIHYENEIYRQSARLAVRAREPGETEREQWLRQLARELPKRILGENESLSQVHKQLTLPVRDEKTGISLRWFSEKPERIDETGFIDLVGLEKPERILLKAELRTGELEREVMIPVTLYPPGEDGREVYKNSLAKRLNQSLSDAAGDRRSPTVELPGDLGDGAEVSWRLQRDRTPFLIPMAGILLCLGLYQRRYAQVEKEGKSRREAMRREFPELVNQMVLLLNAGLVVNTALLEIAEPVMDAEDRKANPLFYELWLIAQRVGRSNVSFASELMAFSQSVEIRELIRFSSLVLDNVDKGSSLAGKLEREGELLRSQQRRNAEEQGRLAETRLSFPLMLLLLVLIMIAVAPVLFEV